MAPLEIDYRRRFEAVLKPLAAKLETQIKDYLQGQERIDRVTARAKAIDRFLKKADATHENGFAKYSEPLRQIQDQIGARIIVFYLSDIEPIAAIIQRYFRPIEMKDIVPDSDSKFGYVGKHFIFHVPRELTNGMDKAMVPDFFELQLKTLFQHAWSEAEHDLGYKVVDRDLTSDENRRLAFTAAQSWGADLIFDELFQALSG